MNATATITNYTRPYSVNNEDLMSRSLSRWTAGLVFSSGFGILVGLLGTAIEALSILGIAHESSVQVLGTAGIVLSFPLLILAAHCLDEIRTIEKRIRLQHFRKHGFKDDNH